MRYNGVDDFLTAGSIDSYARCLDNGGALAYTRGDGSLVNVLGRNVPDGTSTIETTGARLNMPGVDTATLTVTVTRVENVVNQPDAVSAEAYLQVDISGELRDADGRVIHDGPMLRLVEGHVTVTCKPSIAPSSSSVGPSSSSPSNSGNPQTNTGPPSSESPTSPSPTPTSESPLPTTVSPSASASESPSGPSASDSGSGSPSASSSDGTSDATSRPVPSATDGAGGGGTSLPITGVSVLGVLVTGLAATALSLFLLIVANRREVRYRR